MVHRGQVPGELLKAVFVITTPYLRADVLSGVYARTEPHVCLPYLHVYGHSCTKVTMAFLQYIDLSDQ